MPTRTLTPQQHATIFNELIDTAGGQLARMRHEGIIDDGYYSQLVAILNSTIYVLAFAAPSGTLRIQNERGTRETCDVVTSNDL